MVSLLNLIWWGLAFYFVYASVNMPYVISIDQWGCLWLGLAGWAILQKDNVGCLLQILLVGACVYIMAYIPATNYISLEGFNTTAAISMVLLLLIRIG